MTDSEMKTILNHVWSLGLIGKLMVILLSIFGASIVIGLFMVLLGCAPTYGTNVRAEFVQSPSKVPHE